LEHTAVMSLKRLVLLVLLQGSALGLFAQGSLVANGVTSYFF
jgi:hypothetical protein